MLLAIREKAQGWIAWAIVILITIPFALFGIQEYLGTGADPVVADVDGTEINKNELDRGVRDFRDSMRMALGDAYRQEMFEGEAFRAQILDRLIDETLLRQAASDWNMRTSDQQVSAYIKSIPAFQNNGQFEQRMYEATVRNRGLSNAGFEDLVRQDLIMRHMQGGVRNTAFITDSALAERVRLAEQKRDIGFARIPLTEFRRADAVSDEDARAYYEQNKTDYQVPERVKLAYVRLGVEELAPLVESDEQALREFFDLHRGEFVVDEERRVRHILIGSAAGSDEEQEAKAQALLEQLQGGADFAELARANSDDPGSAANGGDLGWINRGVMVESFEEAAFSLPQGELSGAVKTDFGYHIIQVTETRGGSTAGFEDVRDQVASAYRKQQAEDLYYNYYERLVDAAYENPDSLQPAAELLGLEVQRTGWVTRGGALPEQIDVPKVANAAFSEDVLTRGFNSEVIELGPTSAVVLRIVEHEPETIRPFDQVREQVVQAAAAAMASEKAAQRGQEVLEQLRGGADLAEVAQQQDWSFREAEVGRTQRDVPAEIVAAAFAMQAPGSGAATYAGVVSAEGDYFLIELSKVIDGKLSEDVEPGELARQEGLLADRGEAEFLGLVDALRERADVEIYKERLE
jgi:peptidyl-prolyl cis-trans isomerase D